MLPSRVFNILVPPDVAWESLDLVVVNRVWEVLPERYNIPAEKPDATSSDGVQILDWGDKKDSLSDGMNLEVYEEDGFFPSAFVELLPYSQMRKWKFARVRFRPFQYNSVTGELRLIKRARVEITYGNPASINCTYIELDCDDSDPDVNPGMTEIQEDGMDNDCSPDTPQWGTPASLLGKEYNRSSNAVNYFAFLMIPAGVVMALKRFRAVRCS